VPETEQSTELEQDLLPAERLTADCTYKYIRITV